MLHFENDVKKTCFSFLLDIVTEWQISASKTTGDSVIVGESAVQTLKFSCVHKLSIPLPGDTSKMESQPNYLTRCLGIPEKLTLMATIRGNAELKQWEAIEQLLIVKVCKNRMKYDM